MSSTKKFHGYNRIVHHHKYPGTLLGTELARPQPKPYTLNTATVDILRIHRENLVGCRIRNLPGAIADIGFHQFVAHMCE